LVVGGGLGLDLCDDAANFVLALVGGEVLQARQQRELDIKGGCELQREHRDDVGVHELHEARKLLGAGG